MTLATVGSSACLSTSMRLANLRACSSALALQHCKDRHWVRSLLSAPCTHCKTGKTADALTSLQAHLTMPASQQLKRPVMRLLPARRHQRDIPARQRGIATARYAAGGCSAMTRGCPPGGLVRNALKVNDVSDAQDTANYDSACKAHSVQLQLGKEGLLHCLQTLPALDGTVHVSTASPHPVLCLNFTYAMIVLPCLMLRCTAACPGRAHAEVDSCRWASLHSDAW